MKAEKLHFQCAMHMVNMVYMYNVSIYYIICILYRSSDGTNSCRRGISNLQIKIQIHFFSTRAPYKCLNLNAIFCQYNIHSILDIWFLLCLIGGKWTKHNCFYDRYFQVQCEFSKFFFCKALFEQFGSTTLIFQRNVAITSDTAEISLSLAYLRKGLRYYMINCWDCVRLVLRSKNGSISRIFASSLYAFRWEKANLI